MTGPDARTLAFYDQSAADYADRFATAPPRPGLGRFIARIAPGGRVLDLGCGPGADSAAMVAAGLLTDPVDASAAMVAFARETHGLPARRASFEADWGDAAYDGIWASYSLLHAPRTDLPALFAALGRALRPGGALYAGMKLGTGEHRDRLDRLYSYVSADELRRWLTAAGLRIVDSTEVTLTGMAGTADPCIDVLAEKPGNG